MRFNAAVCAWVVAMLCGANAALAADPIGAAAKVEDTLTGPSGVLITGAAIYFNDKLKTDATGVGQIVFKDDTKLAIGPNAEVTIDKFVYNDDGSFKELAVGMTKGTFRWISGKSKPEAYKLSTGWANLAIRGTAFDINVDPEAGQLTLVLYEGEVDLCLLNGDCRKVTGKCRYIVSETRAEVKDPERLPRNRALQLKKSGLIPFIDNERLIESFHLKNASCKVRKVQKQRKAQRATSTRQAASAPSTKTAAVATVRDLSPSRTTRSNDGVTPDPTPSATPDSVDPSPSTVNGPGPVPSRPAKTDRPGYHDDDHDHDDDGDDGYDSDDGETDQGDSHAKSGKKGGRGAGGKGDRGGRGGDG